MSHRKLTPALFALTALAACQAPITFPGQADQIGAARDTVLAACTADAPAAERMALAVNEARQQQGKTLLQGDETLALIAQSHACDMLATGRATVAGSDGSNVVDRARRAEYDRCGVAQLVAVGGTPEGTVAGWLASDQHRVELLEQGARDFGVGVTRDANGRAWFSLVIGDTCR